MFKSREERLVDAMYLHGKADELGLEPFRARRGMIEPAILRVLLDRPMHGYEIMDKIEEQSNGVWRPSAGSIYPTLQMLEEKDLVTAKMEGDKKVYHLTDAGKEQAKQAKSHHDHLREFVGEKWSDKKAEAKVMREVRDEVHEIFKLMRYFRNQKSPEPVQKLLVLLRAVKQDVIQIIEEQENEKRNA